MAWTEVGTPILVVPVGSCEQHGPHLPLTTDTVIATALADDLATRRGDCAVAPAIGISASGEHQGFPGTLSLGTEITAGILIELVRSAEWAAGTVFVNGHGGNATAMQRAAEVFAVEGRNVLIWWPQVADGDPHAGHTETSIMLAIAPEQVRLDRAVPGPTPSIADLVRHGVRPLSDSGVLGDPTHATREHGEQLFRQLADRLADDVARWAEP